MVFVEVQAVVLLHLHSSELYKTFFLRHSSSQTVTRTHGLLRKQIQIEAVTWNRQ